jgi:hypothetical protein
MNRAISKKNARFPSKGQFMLIIRMKMRPAYTTKNLEHCIVWWGIKNLIANFFDPLALLIEYRALTLTNKMDRPNENIVTLSKPVLLS